ncbi:MAG: type II secretion system F family protein, partial [Aureliella sp.]
MSTLRSKSVPESFGRKLMRELTADRSKPTSVRMSSRDLASMLNMLCTLIDNGMPLQKVLGALSSDPSLKKHRKMLKRLHGRLVEGSSLHGAMSLYPNAFPANVVQQVKLGESSGNLSSTLRRIIEQLESWLLLRSSLLQKLSYPAMVTLAGSGLMLFMFTTVVPQFEKIYAESQVSLPWVTSVVTGLSRTLGRHFYLLLLPIAAVVGVWLSIRSSDKARMIFHRILTRLPLIGSFSRDIAILQFLRSV